MLAGLRRSFTGKVAGVALLIVALALIVGFGSFVQREWRVEREALVERVTTISSVMAANVSAPLIYQDRATAHEVLRSARGVPDVKSVLLFDSGGRLFARHGEAAAARPQGRAAPRWSFDHQSLVVRVPVRVDGEPLGELVMVSSLEGLHETFLGYALFAGLMFLAVAGAAARLAVTLARRVIKPVRDLSVAMREVRESGEFAQTVQPGRDAELAELAEEFNLLLTELARRNTALVEARDAAEAGSRAKTEFLANMSHELRTPLNAVVGLTPVLALEPLTPKQRDYLDVIESSANNLLQMLNHILDMAKLDGGRVQLEAVVFDPRPLVTETCAVFRAIAQSKGVQLSVHLDPELGPAYRGDPVRVKQVLTHLLSNAVKFTGAGEVRVLLGPDGEEAGMLKLVVADTGLGIDPDQIATVFDKFVQADLSSTRRHGGAGLGLAICRELVGLMGGRIEVESRPGEGARFTVRFRLQSALPSPARPPRSQSGERRGQLVDAPAGLATVGS